MKLFRWFPIPLLFAVPFAARGGLVADGEPAPPKVSICIPVYNVEAYVAAALDSALGQTLEDIEVICVDDGSTDGSLAILKSYAAKDPRLRVLENGRNRGTLYGRVRLALESRGDYIIWLDPDDELSLSIAETCYGEADASGADIVLFRVEMDRGSGFSTENWINRGENFSPGLKNGPLIKVYANRRTFPYLTNKLYRGDGLRRAALALLPFAESHHIARYEDVLLFWFTAQEVRNFVAIPAVGYRYFLCRGRNFKREKSAAYQRKAISDMCAVTKKILSDCRNSNELRLALAMLRCLQKDVFGKIAKLPVEERATAMGKYVAAFPATERGELSRCVREKYPKLYKEMAPKRTKSENSLKRRRGRQTVFREWHFAPAAAPHDCASGGSSAGGA